VDSISDNIAFTSAAVTAEWGAEDPYAVGTRGGTVKAVTDAKDGLILPE
jgi:hypothetical protein